MKAGGGGGLGRSTGGASPTKRDGGGTYCCRVSEGLAAAAMSLSVKENEATLEERVGRGAVGVREER